MTPREIEISALHGDELPDGLNAPEQCLFLALRQLYRDYRAKAIDKNQAQREKQRILESFKGFEQTRNMYEVVSQRYRQTEFLMSKVEKNKTDCPTCGTARKIIRILDGRK